MHLVYVGSVDKTVVQVRDVPVEVIAILKARAEVRGQSLSAYLRDLLAQEAATPAIDEVITTIAAREPVRYTLEDLREFAADGRP